MANKKGVLREDLNKARRLAAQLKKNMDDAPPELSVYWQREWQEAYAEVRRLQRELTS